MRVLVEFFIKHINNFLIFEKSFSYYWVLRGTLLYKSDESYSARDSFF